MNCIFLNKTVKTVNYICDGQQSSDIIIRHVEQDTLFLGIGLLLNNNRTTKYSVAMPSIHFTPFTNHFAVTFGMGRRRSKWTLMVY